MRPKRKNDKAADSGFVLDQPLSNWYKMPNEIKAKIIGKMNLETRLNARACFRNFDVLSNISKKSSAEIYIKCQEENYAEVELRERISEFSNILIMKWEIREIRRYNFQVIRKNSSDIVLSRKNVHRRFASPTAFLLAGKLFKNPIFDVKLLELELGVTWLYYNFNLVTVPLDMLILRNCKKREVFKGFIRSHNFNCRQVREICDGIETSPEEIQSYFKTAFEARNSLKNHTIREYKSMNTVLTKPSSLKKIELTFKEFFLRFCGPDCGNFLLRNMDKAIKDIMCLRAAFYTYPAECFKLMKGNHTGTIQKLQEGIENHSMSVEVVAMLTGVYISKTCQIEVFPPRYHAALQNLLEEEFDVIQGNDIYNKLVEKIEWLHSRPK